VRRDAPFAVALGAVLTLIAFTTAGGDTDLGANTWTAIALVALGFGLVISVLIVGARARIWGGAALGLFAALALLSALSIAWSIVPDKSWVEAGRVAGYLGAFAAALALVRLAPERWRAIVGGILLASLALSAWAVLVKVFPGSLDRQEQYGRLLAPFGYWNATGLMAAIGLVPCLWLGARSEGGVAERAISVPGTALLVAVIVLSYSRSAVLAALVAVAVWLIAVPRRLRSALVLALAGAGGALISAWALHAASFTHDNVALSTRISQGRTFGIVVLVVVIALVPLGYLALARADKTPLSGASRRKIGTALICLVALVPIAGIGAAAASTRGLGGQASRVWNDLTSTQRVGDTPGRLVALANSRPSYWHEGLTVGEHALLAGVGADGFGTAQTRYADDTLHAGHAHSYLIQTFADLGLIGVALSLALLVAWVVAAARALREGEERSGFAAHAVERAGMWSLLCVVLALGVSSTVDWTWEYAGVAVPAVIAAGWLAGRGPLEQRGGRRPSGTSSGVGVRLTATGLAALAVLICWAILQPLRSNDAQSAAITALTSGNGSAALADANTAVSTDPVAAAPLWVRSEVYSALGDRGRALSDALAATALQPQNPQTWAFLGRFYMAAHEPHKALAALERAHALALSDPLVAQQLAAAQAQAGA
jgi:O-Antigen ligase